MTSHHEFGTAFTIERLDDSTTVCPTKWFGAGSQQGSVYLVKRSGDAIWSVGIDFGEASHVPFREEVCWRSTRTVVIGGGNVVYFFDADSGNLQSTIAVPSFFGHLAIITIANASETMDEILLVMGWTDVHAIDSQFQALWAAQNVAVDGILFSEVRDDAIILSAEMDPPGGWVNVALDARTGAELWRDS